jgi:hypothetical protein
MIRNLSQAICVILLAALAGGCASDAATLRFQSVESGKFAVREFRRAYYSKTEDGQYTAVLTDDGINAAPAKSSGAIPAATSTAPLRQVVSIRVLWRPLRGSKPDAPSTTNAVIDWYVRSNTDPASKDMLHYRGAGFISIYGSGETARFTVRNARVELAEQSGRLQDPLGQTELTGSFLATRSDTLAASSLQTGTESPDLHRASPASSHMGPPPRTMLGP